MYIIVFYILINFVFLILQLAKLEKENSTNTVLKNIIPSQTSMTEKNIECAVDNSAIAQVEAPETTSKQINDNECADDQTPSPQENAGAEIPAKDEDMTNKTIGEAKKDVIEESQPFSVAASAETRCDNGFRIVSPKYKPPVSRFAPKKDVTSATNATAGK